MILLDTEIRDWVVLPVIVVVLSISLVRDYLNSVIQQSRATPAKPTTDRQRRDQFDDVIIREIQARCATFERHSSHLSEKAFKRRRAHLISELEKDMELVKDSGGGGPLAGLSSLADPSKMGATLKGQLLNVLPNIALFGVISALFSGMLACKLPFPLPPMFRVMTQRGMPLTTVIDPSYVTALLVYFVVLFSLRAWLLLLFGSTSAGAPMFAMPGMMPGAGGAASPLASLFGGGKKAGLQGAVKNLKLIRYDSKKYSLLGIETKVVDLLREKRAEQR